MKDTDDTDPARLPRRGFRVGLNPLPWVLTAEGFTLSVPVLQEAFTQIATTPFRGIHADPPAELDVEGYRSLLAEHGLVPAPGYFGADFHEAPTEEVVAAATAHARVQAQLGNTEVFIAANLWGPRFTGRPAVGADFQEPLLQRVIDNLGAAAEAITAEGVRPALHPHVGTLVEVEHEVRAVLQAIPASVLAFGPDTGHLSWAGMDPAVLIGDYADRVAAVHLKDVHLDQVRAAREAGADYVRATGEFTVWTEPGRGDVDLLAALRALPDGFDGWVIVEVDVPEAATNLESTRMSAQWVTDNLGSAVFTAGSR